MSVWRGLFGPARTQRPPADDRRHKLPRADAFVEISINGSRRRESIAINAVEVDALVTRLIAGLRSGDAADFLYTNDAGKFRFATVCTKLAAGEAFFALPAEIKTLESFANRRAAPRVPWLAPAQWRYAPGGRGSGEFYPASMMDLSSAGSALVVGAALAPGTQVEVRFRLTPGAQPLTALSEVVRATRIETSDKNAAGLQFLDVDAELARMLGAFVFEQQTVRRERGVL